MSIRNVRKLIGENSLPPPEGNSDEEFQPLYAKSSSSTFKYEGGNLPASPTNKPELTSVVPPPSVGKKNELILSSHSESEHESTDAIGIENACSHEISKKKKKKKKKQRKTKNNLPKTCSKEEFDGLDEIDKSLMEVNALLGAPPAAPPPPEPEPVDPAQEIFAVQLKHLNVATELKKLFGPDALSEEGGRRKGRAANLNWVQKKITLVPIRESVLTHQKCGLSMTIHREENGFTYFVFAHSREYQRIHKALVARHGEGVAGTAIEEARRNMHVEALLEVVVSMIQYEAYSAATSTLELIIAYMQYVSHPLFRLTNMKVRLEYQFIENRAFHIAVFQYMYMLSNKACHRTALEMAKMLLNLDPSDPLAILLIIDTLALRAREHQWLIDALEYWQLERDAEFLLNLQYSYAMAQFHVAKKAKSDLSRADFLLKAAMMRYPGVIPKIFECASITPNKKMADCPLFKSANETTGRSIKEMTNLYANLCWSKWREPAVLEWTQRVTAELADEYEQHIEVQNQVKELINVRQNLFRGFPREVRRHFSIIKPMTELLFDRPVSFPVNRASAYNPVPPPDGKSRYGYDVQPTVLRALARNSPFYDLITSMFPNYPQQALERQLNNVLLDEIDRAANQLPPEAQAALLAQAAAVQEPPDAEEAAHDPNNTALYIEAVTNAFLRFLNIEQRNPDGDPQNQPPPNNDNQPPADNIQENDNDNIPNVNNTDQAHSSGSQPDNSTDSPTDQTPHCSNQGNNPST